MRRRPNVGTQSSSSSSSAMPFDIQFRNELNLHGLYPPRIEQTRQGKPYRWTNQGGSPDACWYLYSAMGDTASGQFGNFQDPSYPDKGKHWYSRTSRKLTKVEKAEFEKEIAQLEEVAESYRVSRVKRARIIFKNSVVFEDQQHEYLDRKNVFPYRIKFHDGIDNDPFLGSGPYVVIPFRNADGKLKAVQVISEAEKDNKRTHGVVSGCFHELEKPSEDDDTQTIYIGEGYATCASVQNILKRENAVCVMSESCHNMHPVSATIRTKYPKRKIVMLVDNDESLAGLKASFECAKAIDGYLAFPDIEDVTDQLDQFDFNDVHALCIDDDARTALKDALINPTHWKAYEAQYAAIAKQHPEPLPLRVTLPKEPEFNVDWLPEGLQQYCREISEHASTPLSFAGTALFMALSATVGSSIAVQPKPDGPEFLLYPNLWGVLIGRPATNKSGALTEAFRFIDKENEKLSVAYSEARREARDANNPKVKPKPVHYLVYDLSVQALQRSLAVNPTGVSYHLDEFVSVFHDMKQKHNAGLRTFLLKSWRADQGYAVERRSSDGDALINDVVHVPRCSISIFGGSQPHKMLPYFADELQVRNSDTSDDDGFTQRLQLLAWSDEVVSPSNKSISGSARRESDAVFEHALKTNIKVIRNDLLDGDEADLDKALEEGKDDKDNSEDDENDALKNVAQVFKFSKKAQLQWFDFAQERIELSNAEILPGISSHMVKLDKLCAALVALIHIGEFGNVETDDNTRPFRINADTLSRAIEATEYYANQAERLYKASSTHGFLLLDIAKSVMLHLLDGKLKESDGSQIEFFTASNLYTNNIPGLDVKNSKDVIKLLEDYHWILPSGKRDNKYSINPRALDRRESLLEMNDD